MAQLIGFIPAIAGALGEQQAGDIRKAESEVEASQIETAAAAREADRKEDLANAIASQTAGVGASGISAGGSPLTIIQEDISREEEATRRDIFQTRLGALTTRARGRSAQRVGQGIAAQGLLEAGAKAAENRSTT